MAARKDERIDWNSLLPYKTNDDHIVQELKQRMAECLEAGDYAPGLLSKFPSFF
jgi:hypothetical protein